MLTRKSIFVLPALCLCLSSCSQQPASEKTPAKHAVTHTAPATPDDALSTLRDGNKRFLADSMENTNYKEQIAATKDAQHPFAMVLGCMDSRIPPEILFDQGIGNIFVSRVAGNIEDVDILGSMEYAAVVKGVKLIVVMGHTHCGAVTAAVTGEGPLPENLDKLVADIKPARTGDTTNKEKMIDESAKNNVKITIADITKRSKALNDLVSQKKLLIVGAYYDLATGKVEFI